jgi:regulator of sigma E protease|tara:strand:- start:99 stop:1409 length:1311 start_codon:yes stop_codon:yes gene_type:complete
MEVILIKAFQLILSLSILVVLHELGHFIPAKLFGTRVEKFYLFFDWPFSLFKKKIGGTEYGIGVLPLGGYVKIAGMVDESFDTEQLKNDPQDWEFRSKPTWQRLIIMLGGVIVNFILGFLIYMMVTFVWGKNILTYSDLNSGFKVSETMKDIGFQDGDKILKIDGSEVENQLEIPMMMVSRDVSKVEVLHDDGTRDLIDLPEDIGLKIIASSESPFTPLPNFEVDSIVSLSPSSSSNIMVGDIINKANGSKIYTYEDLEEAKKINVDYVELELIRDGNMITTVIPFSTDDKKIGIYPRYSLEGTTLKYGFFESITKGAETAYYTLTDYVNQMKYLASPEGASQLGGFGTIGNIFPAQWNWKRFWEMTAFLSIILGFMNVLPIPALDGGHVMFLLYEMVTGRKPNDKFMEYATMIGVFLLLGLVLYANGMDIFRAFF